MCRYRAIVDNIWCANERSPHWRNDRSRWEILAEIALRSVPATRKLVCERPGRGDSEFLTDSRAAVRTCEEKGEETRGRRSAEDCEEEVVTDSDRYQVYTFTRVGRESGTIIGGRILPGKLIKSDRHLYPLRSESVDGRSWLRGPRGKPEAARALASCIVRTMCFASCTIHIVGPGCEFSHRPL